MNRTFTDVAQVDFKLEEPDDPTPDIEADYSKLNAVNTCPTWGIVRYELSKTFENTGRAMAQEAGSACHEAFAAIRVLDLFTQDIPFEDIVAVSEKKFGVSRFNDSSMCKWLTAYLDAMTEEDARTYGLNFALEALDTSGFYDDPRDNRRTLSNLEEAIISYYDKWPSNRGRESTIYVGEDLFVGIELPFAIRILFKFKDETSLHVRYIGKIDGLHRRKSGELVAHENKTASRLGEAWSAGMRMTHQTTGYTVAASLITGERCNVVYSHGLAIPQPRSGYANGVTRDIASRHERHIRDWLAWILDQAFYIKEYRDNPVQAPRYTMSCNRYFRPCSFIPLCDQEPDEFIETLDDMIEDKWSPLDE